MTCATRHQQILDVAHNTIQGFDDSSAKSILLVLSRQLGQLRTRADDVANWPNVCSFIPSLWSEVSTDFASLLPAAVP